MQRNLWRGAAICAVAIGTSAVALVATGSPANAARKPVARAVLHDVNGEEIGEVLFVGPGRYADRVKVRLTAPSAPNLGKFHGFHVHATGVCNPNPSGTTNVPFGSAGGHWNPTAANHGDHVGDLPSVLITEEGETFSEFETDRFDVTSLIDAAGDGAAVILHVDRDNFANVPPTYGTPNAATLATGDAGGRHACGVVTQVR